MRKNQLDLKLDEISLARMRRKRPNIKQPIFLLYGDLRSAKESGSEVFRNSILVGALGLNGDQRTFSPGHSRVTDDGALHAPDFTATAEDYGLLIL